MISIRVLFLSAAFPPPRPPAAAAAADVPEAKQLHELFVCV